MTALLYGLPALVLLVALVFGHYPGERLLHGVAARRRLRPLASAVPPPRNLSFVRPRLPRGGALLGAALAGRAPPSVPRAQLWRRAMASMTKGFR